MPIPLNEVLNRFAARYTSGSEAMVAAKLGLREYLPSDEQLSNELFELMGAVETDMTLFFRNLADVDLEHPTIEPLMDAYYEPAALSPALRERTAAWLETYAQRVRAENWPERVDRMNAANPRFVPRNYLAQLAIDEAERGEFALLHELMDVLRHPYDEQPGKERFAEKRPEWARNRAGCSMLSCSS